MASYLRAIKAHCKICSGDDHPKYCQSRDCPLFHFKLGRDSLRVKKDMSEEQKQELLKRLSGSGKKGKLE